MEPKFWKLITLSSLSVAMAYLGSAKSFHQIYTRYAAQNAWVWDKITTVRPTLKWLQTFSRNKKQETLLFNSFLDELCGLFIFIVIVFQEWNLWHSGHYRTGNGTRRTILCSDVQPLASRRRRFIRWRLAVTIVQWTDTGIKGCKMIRFSFPMCAITSPSCRITSKASKMSPLSSDEWQ